MKKIWYKIIKSWNTEITDKDGKTKKLIGIKFMFSGSNERYTIFIEDKLVNMKKIEKALKDFYVQHIQMDKYANIDGEIEIE